MLLAIEFDNLHQILRSLYTDMMPLCGNMAGVAKGIAGLGALFYVAAARQCRTDRCLPASPSLCDWLLYYVLPHIRTGYD